MFIYIYVCECVWRERERGERKNELDLPNKGIPGRGTKYKSLN